MSLPFTVRDHVPGCSLLIEGTDIETIGTQIWDHISDEHDASPTGKFVTYTHTRCGQTRASEIGMYSHLKRCEVPS